MRNFACWILGFLVVLFTNGICFGATIFVDQSGGGDFTTIQNGINAASPGDTVKVGPGLYQTTVIIDKNINLAGSGPKYTTIQASGDGIIVEAGMNTEITNFTITAGGYGVYSYGNYTSFTVRNCVIVGCGSTGIYYNGGAGHIAIINNTIAENNRDGLYYRSTSFATDSPHNIQGNIIVYNGGDGIYHYINSGVQEDENISYNCIYGNATNYNSSFPGTGDISVDPLFIDRDSGNYVLQSTSECIDIGIPGESFNDPDGTRNDMGVYSGPPSAAFWPYISRGPAVSEITLTPASVPRGGTITIQAKGRVQ